MKAYLTILTTVALLLSGISVSAQPPGEKSPKVPVVAEHPLKKGNPSDSTSNDGQATPADRIKADEPAKQNADEAKPEQPSDQNQTVDYDKFRDDNNNGIDDRFEETEKQKVKVQEATETAKKEKVEQPKN